MRQILVVLLALGLAGCTSSDSDQAQPAATVADGAAPTSAATTEASAVGSPDDATTDGAADANDAEANDADATTDGELEWTVVAVGHDDVLNVRSEPDAGADIVTTLAPWTSDFAVTGDVDTEGSGTWRRVDTSDGSGWVNARYLVAQPASFLTDHAEHSATLTQDVVDWVITGGGALDSSTFLADRALWVGGIGIYADAPAWNWVPAEEADEHAEWLQIRRFSLGEEGFECGTDCDRSLVDYVHFDRLGETWTIKVDDHLTGDHNGFTDGVMFQAPDLHRVVVDKPSTEGVDADGEPMINLDFQRIHFVYDWSDGADRPPRLAMIHTWGWTP